MKWLHFILSHSIFIAVCAAAMALQTSQLLHADHSVFVYGFIFFSTLCGYNFYWLLSRYTFGTKTPFAEYIKKESTGMLLFGSAAAGLLFCLWRSSIPPGFVLVAVLFTVIYSIPLFPMSFLHFKRRTGVMKTLLLAITWTYVTAFIPIEKKVMDLDNPEIFIISRRFLFLLMLCIIFDSRDIAVDKIRGFRSLATDLSPRILKWLIYSIFTLLFATNFFSGLFGFSIFQTIALQISSLALLTVYFYSTKKQGYLFYYFIVDGLMIFSALTTWIASI